MYKKILLSCALLASAGLSLLNANPLHNKGTKKAILLVTFGTSDPDAKVAFINTEEEARKRFPGVEIRWGFTSNIIRKKLKRQGIVTHSPQLALAQLAEDGYTHVAIQSLHTIPGIEYEKITSIVRKTELAPALFRKITIGAPLLSNGNDVKRSMEELLKQVPAERKPEDAVIMMGHGTHHFTDLIYTAAAVTLNNMDNNAFLGTVEGSIMLDDVLAQCKKNNIKKAYLMPFMSVAGDHAKNDLAGDEDDSWKSGLTKAGITCVPCLKGTAEFDSIVAIWLDNLEKAYKSLDGHTSSH